MKIIHVTDTHLVKAGEKLYKLDPFKRLRKCIDSINTEHDDADMVVFTGDLAHRGKYKEYELLKEALEELTVQYRLVIGNHDNREKFLETFPETEVDQNGFVQSVDVIGNDCLIYLDTLRENSWYGEYCEIRAAWLEDQLLEYGNSKRIYLFMHHPPFPTHVNNLDTLPIVKGEALQRTLIKYKNNIRHLFFGHIHRPIAGSWNGIPYTTLYGTNHQTWLNFRLFVAPASHEPPQYCIVLADNEQVTVHYHMFNFDGKKFPFKYHLSIISDIPKSIRDAKKELPQRLWSYLRRI